MVSWDTRLLSSSEYWVFSHPEICSGDQSNISLLATMFRNLRFTARRHLFRRTTNRYAEISSRTKQAAVAACLPPVDTRETFRPSGGWRKDQELMKWLCSL